MPIELTLLGCRHPAVADALGVIAAEPDVRLAAVWDADGESVPAPIRGYAVGDVETAIARADAVLVCAEVAERAELCARAARAGRPALTLVPLAPSAAQARSLVGVLARNRTPVLAALPLRELAALHRLGANLRAGVLGRLGGVQAILEATPGMVDPPLPPALRRRPPAPHRGFVELSVHLIDALFALGETPRLDAVSLDRRRGGEDLGGAALGRWAGAPLVVRASLTAPVPALQLALQGSRTRAILHDGTLELGEAPGAPQRWVGGPPDPGEPVRAFVDRLRRRDLPDRALLGVVRAQAIAERAQPLG